MMWSSGAITVCLGASLALAGPEWPEIGDAGSLPGTAQPVIGGGGPLTKINGELTGPPGLPGAGLGDYEDMYLIFINDPGIFRASTLLADDGFANFDPSLWLFNADGTALLGNLDAGIGTQDALLLGESNDGSGAMITAPGLYLLAISGSPNIPLGGISTQPMFNFGATAGEISGPDGPGGGLDQITDWSGPGGFGLYSIALQGVSTIVPAPAGLCALSGLLIGVGRRRRSFRCLNSRGYRIGFSRAPHDR